MLFARSIIFLLTDTILFLLWSELASLAASDIKAARDKLIDIISDYAGYSGEIVILVFDAYRVSGGKGEIYRVNDVDIVYTKEAETADLYIEKTAHSLAGRHRVTVATSDAVEQVIIFGSGAIRLSARGLLERVIRAKEEMRDRFVTTDD
jgi:Predicted RNA-binding protein containing a PIN domain